MSNLITSAIIAKETLLNFRNNLVIAGNCDWKYNEKFGQSENPIGNSYNLRRPIAVNVVENNMAWNASLSSVQETTVQLVIDRTLTVPMSFSEGDLALKIADFSSRYVAKAARTAASRLDFRVADAIVNSTVASASNAGLQTAGLAGSAVGTPNAAGYVVGAYGTALTPATILDAKAYLMEVGCPDDGEIYGVLTPTAQTQLNSAQATLFNPLLKTDSVYMAGRIGNYAGIEFSASQSCATHVNGTLAALAVTSGTLTASWAESATLLVTSSAGVNPGDMFQSTVKLVNPLNKQPVSHAAQFQVISIPDATHVVVSPAPISAGAYQNVAATIDGTSLTLVGATGATGSESLIFHKEAVACASPDLVLPKKSSVDMAELIKNDDIEGFVLRFLRIFDGIGASGSFGGGVGVGGSGMISRLDSAWGVKVANTAWVVRIRN